MEKQNIESGNYKGINYQLKHNDGAYLIVSASGSGPDRQLKFNDKMERILELYKLSTIHFDIQKDGSLHTVHEMEDMFHEFIEFSYKVGFSKDKVGVLGSSFSGLSAVIASSHYENMKISLNSPVIYMQELIENRLNILKMWGWLLKGSTIQENCRVPFSLYRGWRDYRLEKVLENLEKNSNELHISHGDNDGIVPLESSKRFYNSLKEKNIKSKLEIIGGGTHKLINNEYFFEKIAPKICDFFLAE